VLGHIDDRARTGWWFQLFLVPAGDEVVACLGVSKEAQPRSVADPVHLAPRHNAARPREQRDQW
jgi:hypothetical protein